MQLFFQLQIIPLGNQVRYASFHLTDATNVLYSQMARKSHVATWEAFVDALFCEFGHLAVQGTQSNYHQPRWDGPLND